MKHLFITDNPEIAAYVESCGVERVMIDLEILGKAQRQGGRDTVISCHRAENIAPVRRALMQAELLVRVNPLHPGTLREVETCIDAGADYLMLPMFRSARQLDQFCRFVAGRVPVVPLVETAAAMHDIQRVVTVEGVAEVYIGLNDLHLDLGMSFLFEPLAAGLVDAMADACREVDLAFGVGGISTVGQGIVPAELVLAEHARLSSTRVILSRSFHQRAASLADLRAKIDLPRELEKVRRVTRQMNRRTPDEIAADTAEFRRRVTTAAARSA